MGGLACLIPWNAVVTFETIPSQPRQQEKLEQQIRTALLVPSIYDSVVERGHGLECCELLEKKRLSLTELTRLFEIAKPPY